MRKIDAACHGHTLHVIKNKRSTKKSPPAKHVIAFVNLKENNFILLNWST